MSRPGDPVNNNEIFEQFWQDFKWPEPAPVFYRVYYSELGEPLVYSMEELPGKYIEITAAQFAASDPHARVRDGKLIHPQVAQVSKLAPAATGTPCDPATVAIVVAESQPNQKWKLRHYENN
jgi:hypothetical protein